MRREKLFSDRVESWCDKLAYFKYLDLMLLTAIVFICGMLSGYFWHRQQIINQLSQLGF